MAFNIVKQIKDTVLGVKSNEIDAIIDDSLSKIDKYTASQNNNKYIESMKQLITASGADGSSLLKSLSNSSPQVQNYDTSGRVNRYNEYDSICAKIPYCERALQAWVDHIVSPDEILKTSLQVCPLDKDTNDDEVNVAVGRVNTLIRHFDIENKIREIIKTTLKKGDNFIEFVKTPNGANTLVVLNEGFDPSIIQEKKILHQKKYVYVEESKGSGNVTTKIQRKVNIVVDEAYSTYNLGGIFSSLGTQVSGPNYPNINAVTSADVSGIVAGCKSKDHSGDISNIKGEHIPDDKFRSKFDKIEKDATKPDEKSIDLDDLSIVIHDPKYIIRLETKRFKVCLGYLVFPKVDILNVQAGVVNNIDSMCAQLLTDVKQKLSTKVKIDDEINISDDVKKVLLTHLQHIEKNDDLKVRYVNPDLMQHFKLKSDKYDPYGESIFDSVLFACRMYIAQKTAAVVKQINACTDKRFISLEIGIPRDAKNVIEKMKEQINKKRITVDSLGNTDTIPSQISTWENIFIPMKDGKKYVEIDHQQWSPNANEDVEQLKNAANEIIGNLGVPPAYLNMDENCLPYDQKIKLLDGNDIEIGKLVNLWEQNENNRNVWVYSVDTNSNKVVPGKVTNVYRTRKNAEIMRVWLDNGEYVDSTPDHRYMLRDGSYTEARNLKSGDSLMPLYLRESKKINKTRLGVSYLDVYDPKDGKWRLVHRMVTEELNRILPDSGLHVHHLDRNPRNNHPDNLLICTKIEHNRIHSQLKNKDSDGNVLYENLYHGLIEKRNCKYCGKEFECHIQSKQCTCHSDECMKKMSSDISNEYWNEYKKNNPQKCSKEVECFICHKKFMIEPWRIERYKDNRYVCSNKCSAAKSSLDKKNKRIIDKHYHECECIICGNKMIMNDDKKIQTCSIKCLNTYLANKRWNEKEHGKTIQCSLCGKPIHVADWYYKQNQYFACQDDKCKHAIKCLKQWLRKNPDKTIEDYRILKGIKPYNYMNHKVVRTEFLQERKDCYDIEVENYHNFGLSSGVFVHNSGSRSTLTAESINWARSIIARQQDLTPCLHQFFYKAFCLIWGRKEAQILKKLQITFQVPRIAPMNINVEYIENSQRAIDALASLGLSKEYLKRQYMPYIDWDRAEKDAIKGKLKQETGEEAAEDGGMGLGGMGGGMPMPTGGGMDMGGMM